MMRSIAENITKAVDDVDHSQNTGATETRKPVQAEQSATETKKSPAQAQHLQKPPPTQKVQQDAQKQPQPGRIKKVKTAPQGKASGKRRVPKTILFIGLFVVLAIAGTSFYAIKTKDNVMASLEAAMAKQPEPTIHEIQTSAEASRLEEYVAKFATLVQAVEALKKEQLVTKNAIDEWNAKPSSQSLGIESEAISKLEATISGLLGSKITQGKRISSLEARHKARTPKTVKKTVSSRRVPFNVVSIDRWDGKQYVGIVQKNSPELQYLAIGQSSGGWTVMAIEDSVVTLRGPGGKKVTRTIQ